MTLWLDAQLPPSIAAWVETNFGLTCRAVRDLNLHEAKDPLIFEAARAADAVVMTKDSDFVELLRAKGPPPAVILITCGNTSNAKLRQVLSGTLADAIRLIESGEPLVEIGDDFTSP
jgi:predicted nuclease of predicted toxin-antitoxin system